VLKGQGISLTLGLTGFTSSNWSQTTSFDLLLPRSSQTDAHVKAVVKHLEKCWVDDLTGITKATKLSTEDALAALQKGCSHGQFMHDVARQSYRYRPVMHTELDLEKLTYRNAREKEAHDLNATKGAVKITSENRIHGVGIEITGKVKVAADKREYSVQLLLNDDGMVVKADCTCQQFRTQGLKHGPCAHLIALRIAYAERVARRQQDNKSRHTITVETKTFSKRISSGEEMVQISLNKKRLTLKWGVVGKPMRRQQFQFSTIESARTDYLNRIQKLSTQQFLETQ